MRDFRLAITVIPVTRHEGGEGEAAHKNDERPVPRSLQPECVPHPRLPIIA